MPDADPTAVAARFRDLLTRSAHASGGWSYVAGRSARIEPTAWALLALSAGADTASPAWQNLAAPHLAFLSSCQRPSGLLTEDPGLPPNFTANGAALCALAHLAVGQSPSVDRLAAGLVAVKGLSVDEPDPRQDNRLQGWPWVPDTFSWVEPTCWCVLALKQRRSHAPSPAAEARIEEAERLLVNRSCEEGGWNYGNASALGQDLRPYVPTTALGLLALQDRGAQPVVARALSHLEAAQLGEPSGLALALAALALRVMSRPAGAVEARLADRADRIERTGNLQTLAMALFALTAGQHEARALRV